MKWAAVSKTITAVATAGAGYQLGYIKRVLIVAPTSVCAVWPKEFQDYAAFPYTIRTMLGDKAKRLKELRDLEAFPYEHLKVAVCEEWENSFEAFQDWALKTGYDENAPRGACTIDRIDVDGDYCPKNCRWTDMQNQRHNRRDTI